MQKKTCALASLAVAVSGGVLLTGSPAHAQSTLVQGHRDHRHYSSHRSSNRNVNVNRNVNRNVVRVNIHNVNRNVSSFHEVDHADRDRDNAGFLFNRCHFGCNRGFERDRFDRDDRGDEDRGDRIIVGNDIRSVGDRDNGLRSVGDLGDLG